jgi:hypothetical protein
MYLKKIMKNILSTIFEFIIFLKILLDLIEQIFQQ